MIRAIKCVSLFLASIQFAAAYPGKHFHLNELVEAADVIVVADVSVTQQSGPATASVDGRPVDATSYLAELRVQRRLKGSCPDELTFDFTTPLQFVGIPGVGPGYQMVFLKKNEMGYLFADRHFPSLPAAPGTPAETDTDALQGVIRELGNVMSSPLATESGKWAVLTRAEGIPKSEIFTDALTAALTNSTDDDLRFRIQAELLSRNDFSQLGPVVDLLLRRTLSDERREMFLLRIEKINDPQALRPLRPLLSATDLSLRRAAAQALWHIADPSSISALLKLLDDTDDEVRFYAVRALSDIANDPNWGGPSESEFREHEGSYISHWRDWGRARVPPSK
jgi:hypothetical protein